MIRNLNKSDWPEIKAIYIQGIKTNNATFEIESNVPNFEEWHKNKIKDGCFVFTEKNVVMGWSTLTPVSSRCVYAGVAEVTVYVGNNYQGKGLGRSLLESLIEYAESHNIWTLQAGIFPENLASMAVHQKLGFRIVGQREKIGKQFGDWRDVVLLERRSTTIL